MGHPGGGRASHFFHHFSSLGPIWAPLGPPPQNGAKGLIKGAQSSLWRAHFEVFLSQIGPNMGEKWSHDEALGTILTPGVPKTAQDSNKC